MENEIKVGEYTRNEDGYIEKVDSFDKLTNIYKDEEGILRKWEGEDVWGNEYSSIIVKHSPNLIDIIEDNDFCKIEFYSPRYEEKVIRIFEVSKIDEYITFENFHCDLFMANGEWGCHDKRLNPVIKEIITKEMMESISYKVKE